MEVDFKDRVPLHPGRIQLIPVEGRENVFDVVRADEPTEEGTPINKATLDSITKSRLTGRYYELKAVVDNDSVAYTADMMPSTWDIGQRIVVQVPSFEFTEIASNTFMTIACNTILLPLKRYELVYNGSTFDAMEV